MSPKTSLKVWDIFSIVIGSVLAAGSFYMFRNGQFVREISTGITAIWVMIALMIRDHFTINSNLNLSED